MCTVSLDQACCRSQGAVQTHASHCSIRAPFVLMSVQLFMVPAKSAGHGNVHSALEWHLVRVAYILQSRPIVLCPANLPRKHKHARTQNFHLRLSTIRNTACCFRHRVPSAKRARKVADRSASFTPLCNKSGRRAIRKVTSFHRAIDAFTRDLTLTPAANPISCGISAGKEWRGA